MVILCPKCSTGFNLPEKHITPKGAKLRCSRCSHVFRVRSGLGDEPELFYKPEDDAANAAQAAVDAPHEPTKTYAAPRRSSFDDDDEDDRALGGAARMGVGGFEAVDAGPKLGLNVISEVSSPNHKTQFGNPGLAEVSSPNHKTQFGSPGLAEVSSPNHKTEFGAAARAALREDEPGTMELGPHVAGPGDLGTSTQFGPSSIAATREKSNPKLPPPRSARSAPRLRRRQPASRLSGAARSPSPPRRGSICSAARTTTRTRSRALTRSRAPSSCRRLRRSSPRRSRAPCSLMIPSRTRSPPSRSCAPRRPRGRRRASLSPRRARRTRRRPRGCARRCRSMCPSLRPRGSPPRPTSGPATARMRRSARRTWSIRASALTARALTPSAA